MATTAAIPVSVTPEAATRIAELGMTREFEQMVEHTKQTVPGLRSIRVTLEHDPCAEQEPGLVIWSHRPDPGPGRDPVDDDWGWWLVTTFPPEVCINICMISLYEAAADGR